MNNWRAALSSGEGGVKAAISARMINDRVFFSGLALLAIGLIALAMVWPQGYGARSPGPFGSTPIQQTPQMKAAMAREHAAAMRRQEQARKEAAEAAAATAARSKQP
jgi:hypothetical protein